MPLPQPITTGRPGEAGAVTWAYSLAPGNATGAPYCGTVTVRSPAGTASTTLMGVSMDMTGTQRQILENVVQQHIRPVDGRSRIISGSRAKAAALVPMMDAYVSATDSYTRQLTEAATNVTQQLRAAVKADDLRRGTDRSQNQVDRLWAVNWSGAGRTRWDSPGLNGATLSVLAIHPDLVTPPSLREPGNQHSPRPRSSSSRRHAMEETIKTVVQTTDGTDTPAGYADLYSGASPDEDSLDPREGDAVAAPERARAAAVHGMASPAKSLWQDPFADQVQTGHKLMMVSLTGARPRGYSRVGDRYGRNDGGQCADLEFQRRRRRRRRPHGC